MIITTQQPWEAPLLIPLVQWLFALKMQRWCSCASCEVEWGKKTFSGGVRMLKSVTLLLNSQYSSGTGPDPPQHQHPGHLGDKNVKLRNHNQHNQEEITQ
jgi:hypothetical protein